MALTFELSPTVPFRLAAIWEGSVMATRMVDAVPAELELTITDCVPLVPVIWQYSRVVWIYFDRYFDPDDEHEQHEDRALPSSEQDWP